MATLFAATASRLTALGGLRSKPGLGSRPGRRARVGGHRAFGFRQQVAVALRGALATASRGAQAAERPERRPPERRRGQSAPGRRGAHEPWEPHSKPGRSSSSRSKDGSRPTWPSAAPRGRDGSSSARSRKPLRSTWGLHSRPGAGRRSTAHGGLAASRSTAALLAARMAAGQFRLQPLEQAGAAALRSTCLGTTAGRRTSLGGFAAFGASQQPGRQPGPPNRLARALLVAATTLKAKRATADNRKRRFMGVLLVIKTQWENNAN